jgi:hypothetical protein
MKPRHAVVAGTLAAAALAALAPGARADVLRLENGRTMHGTVDRGYVDEEALRVHLFSTGGTIRVRWDHLIPEDREKWQVDLGLKESEEARELKVDAHKILFVVNAETIHGLVLNPAALDGGPTTDVRIQVKGRELKYPRGQIARVEPARVDLALIYTPRQAYETKRDEIAPNNGPSHFDLAEYARLVGAYDEAKEHYEKAREDGIWKDTPAGRLVESRLVTLEGLLRNRGLQQEIDGVKVGLIEARSNRDFAKAARGYLQARERVLALVAQIQDPRLQKEFKLPELAQRVEVERRKFFESKLPLEMYSRVRRLMYEKAKEQKVRDFPPTLSPQEKAAMMLKGTFEGARQYATRQVTEDLWNSLLKDAGAGDWLAQLEALMAKDPARVTDEDRAKAKHYAQMEKTLKQELLDYWANRNKNTFTVTSYGYGTFIVTGTSLKLTRKPPQAGSGGRGGGPGGQQQAVDVVKTPDQWWEGASGKERQDWLLSWYAERGGLFDPFRHWEEPCEGCAGLGYRKMTVAATGEEEAERCKTCNGAKVVRKVKWR